MLQRKKLVLELRRCQDCLLMFRYPADDTGRNRRFYQSDYREEAVTELPTQEHLERLLKEGFAGSPNDCSVHLQIVRQTAGRGKLLDWGCSWGYAVHQFAQAGYDSTGFEISRPRAEFGRRHLDVQIIDDLMEIDRLAPGSFDIIYTSHVLEHLPEVRTTLQRFRRLLKPDGVILIFVPNGGGRSARELGVRWGWMISEKHTLALDAGFFCRSLPELGLRPTFRSSPYDMPAVDCGQSDLPRPSLDGDELLVIARPHGSQGVSQLRKADER